MHSPLKCLKQVSIFKNVPDDTLEELTEVSTHRVYYKKGDLIAAPNSDTGVIAIDEGKAKVYTLSEDGKEKILYIADKGSINGQDNLFSNKKISRYMQATEDTWVCSIKHNDFQDFLENSPDVAISLLNSIGTRLLSLEVNNSRRDLMKSKDRVFSYLLDWRKDAGNDNFTLPIKKAEFASLLGITPETLSRQLKSLVNDGKIKMKGKQITIIS